MVKKRIIVTGGQGILAALLIFIGLISTQNVTYGQTIPTVTPTLTVTPSATTKATATLKATATVTDTPPPQLNKWSEPYAFERPGWFPGHNFGFFRQSLRGLVEQCHLRCERARGSHGL